MDKTQLTNALTYDLSNLRFRKQIESSLPGLNGAPGVNYKRVPIGTRNSDGSYGDLVLQTGKVYSFGLSPNVSQTSGETEGYTLPLCLTNRNDPTPEEKKWVETFNKIVESVKDHLMKTKEEIGKYDLERVELKKLNPIWYKTEKGKIVDGASPILYAKLMMNKKTRSISTLFTNGVTGEDIDPLTLLNKPCYVEAAIRIESIYIGAKISLQVKIQEANIFLIDNTPKRLLRKPVVVQQVEMSDDVPDEAQEEQKAAGAAAFADMDEDNGVNSADAGDDDGSIKGSDDESDKLPPVVETPKPSSAAPASKRPLKKK